MPETMSPREKVEETVERFANEMGDVIGNPSGYADAILAALASSGDHAELARLAEAATPGPWVSQGRYIGTPKHMSYVGEVRDQNGNWSDTTKSRSDAAFIAAANPATVLALIAEVAALNDYGKSVAKEALAYRNALLLVKDRLKTWPIDDHENCMCGSSIDSHNMGSGHSPVAVADHAINLLIQQIEETLNDPMGI